MRAIYTTDYSINVNGREVKIDYVSSQMADGIWNKDDKLVVWLTLSEPVGCVSGFAVEIPVKHYDEDEFLKVVSKKVVESFIRFEKQYVEGLAKQKHEEERQAGLDAYAEDVQRLLKGADNEIVPSSENSGRN